MDKLPNWLRWVLVPFAAIAVFLSINCVFAIFFWLRWLVGFDDGPRFMWYVFDIVMPIVSSYFGIVGACHVAPGQKFITSLVIGSLFMMSSGFGVFVYFPEEFDYSMLASTIAIALGVGVAIYDIKTNNQPIW